MRIRYTGEQSPAHTNIGSFVTGEVKEVRGEYDLGEAARLVSNGQFEDAGEAPIGPPAPEEPAPKPAASPVKGAKPK